MTKVNITMGAEVSFDLEEVDPLEDGETPEEYIERLERAWEYAWLDELPPGDEFERNVDVKAELNPE